MSKCKSCGRTIWWVTMPSGKKMPVDAEPHPALGNVYVDRHTLAACVLTGEEFQRAKQEGQQLHVSHFAVCPSAPDHRHKKPAPASDAVRECPFAGCDKRISPELFACAAHWKTLSEPLRAKVWAAYRAWQRGDIGAEELRRLQQEVLDAAQGAKP